MFDINKPSGFLCDGIVYVFTIHIYNKLCMIPFCPTRIIEKQNNKYLNLRSVVKSTL